MKGKSPLPLILALLAVWYLLGGKLPWVPTPGPGPAPVGVRSVLIVRETEDTTPEQARLATALRTGTHAEYLKTKGHSLRILDDDAVNENGQPVAELAKYKPFSIPELLIISPPDKLLHRGPLPKTADEVMSRLKEHGG